MLEHAITPDNHILTTDFRVIVEKGVLSVHEDTQPRGEWVDIYQAFQKMLLELDQQIKNRKSCPLRRKFSIGWGRDLKEGPVMDFSFTSHKNTEGSFDNQTKVNTHTNDWRLSYRALLMIRAEVNRQIEERLNCPFHPRNVKRGLARLVKQYIAA